MHQSFLQRSLLLSGTVLMGVCGLFGQTLGSIAGGVRDVSGAAVPAATIMVINTGTNAQRIAVTNAFGVYRFTDVPAGEAYVIVPVSTRYRFTPLVLNVSEDLTGVDFVAETSPKK